MRFQSRIIAIIMLMTFIVSGIEGYCCQVKPSPEKIACTGLSFESNDLDHSLEATINESQKVISNLSSCFETERIKFSIPGILSYLISAATGFTITSYFHSVDSIFFSNYLFLIYSHFTI